ncbi:MAG TPA: efflux RND transporter periplasmic adaptor subunit, partial [Xanthobacteraceae bacterium]|nr:efflux RND transporter periplasmic adaptor subunit [Xanthobacteraceae bacterium]
RLAVLPATAVLLVTLAGCDRGGQQHAAFPPPTVTVAKPAQRTVVDYDEYVGRFVAVDSVEIRSRLSGYLSAIHFTDGQMVKKGDLLFIIDRRPFEIALEQMRANLAQARANLAFAQADLQRGQALLQNKTITEQTYDQRTQAKNVAEASVAAQEAMVNSAELDLDQYSELRAPVDGRIGDRRVSVGNLITGGAGGNTTLLASIVSVDPIRFEFTFDEASYLRYERFAKNRKPAQAADPPSAPPSDKQADQQTVQQAGQQADPPSDPPATDQRQDGVDTGVPVSLKLIDEKDFDHSGKIDFVDNAISTSSGTIRGRAIFANPNGIFVPGMFGRIRVPGSPPHLALLIPDAAIGSEQARKYVLVVDDSGTVRQKYVTLGQLDGGLRVVRDGLLPTDRVIVNGLMHAQPGIKVKPQEQSTPAAPAKAGGQANAG